jgi:hypothetical protein
MTVWASIVVLAAIIAIHFMTRRWTRGQGQAWRRRYIERNGHAPFQRR